MRTQLKVKQSEFKTYIDEERRKWTDLKTGTTHLREIAAQAKECIKTQKRSKLYAPFYYPEIPQ